MRHRDGSVALNGGKVKCSKQSGKQYNSFDLGKSSPRTNPRTGRERHVCVTRAGLAAVGLPTGGVECVRIIPQPGMPVQMPR